MLVNPSVLALTSYEVYYFGWPPLSEQLVLLNEKTRLCLVLTALNESLPVFEFKLRMLTTITAFLYRATFQACHTVEAVGSVSRNIIISEVHIF